jgi:P-type Cu2+ transporter
VRRPWLTAAFLLTIVAVVAGALTLVVWLALGATGAFAVERLVSVLVIACPHALGLAVPLVAAISTSLGAQSGLLVRDRRGLEEARDLTTVVFDKTGTLTRGEFRVVDVATDGSLSADEASPSAQAQTSPSRPVTWSLFGAIHGTCRASSRSAGPAIAR